MPQFPAQQIHLISECHDVAEHDSGNRRWEPISYGSSIEIHNLPVADMRNKSCALRCSRMASP